MATFIPEITQAYQNDPRTKVANALIQSGGNTAPVAGGGWAWADGIARALSGLAGGYVQHKQQQKYEKREADITNAVAAALAGTGGGAAAPGIGGAVPPQGVQASGGTMPAQAQPPAPAPVPPAPQNNAPDPLAPLPDAQQAAPPPPIAQAPQAAPAAPQGPSPASQAVPAAAPQIAAALGGGGAANTAVPFGQPTPRLRGASMVQAMLPITRSTESKGQDFAANGKPTTSPKGAKYAMQVMPATARKPGFGIRPAANDSPEEYNRVGTELLGKLTEKYGGDPAKAWAAYNAGSRRVDHALALAARKGTNWLDHMPAETQAYVKENVTALGTGVEPQRLAGMEAQKPLEPTGPIQYQTAEPTPTALPERPADRGAAQSYRMASGRKLLGVKDPALFERAMAMLDTGMGEQFAADRDALAENNKRDDTLYDAGIGDHYTAENQRRTAAYDARGDERREGFAYGREMRGYAHDDNTLGRQQAFQHNENQSNHQFEHGENALNRSAQRELTQMTIEGKHEDARTKAAQRFQNFLSTPQGSKMYQESTNRMNNLDDIVNQVGAFMELNEKNPTGGMLMNAPTGAGEWFARNLNSNTQAMDAITQKIAPLMRQAGQGSMSDKDLAGFVRSVPNIKNTVKANRLAADRLKLGIQRMNDFEINKLKAAGDGRQVEFLQEWNAYKNQVPFDKGISFDDWKASVPQYKADGSRK